eukprot:s1305_g2.t1
MAAVCLKPSEYHGDQNTAVVGRIVILKHQEIPQKKSVAAAAVPVGGRKGKGGKAGKKSAEPQTLRKLEAHLAATCVAGVALTALGWLWWHIWSPLGPCDAAPLLRGRCGTWRHLPSFCVAGVALGDICLAL